MSADDFVAIQRLVHRYSDAVVNRNAEQWGSCWADDANWDLGGGRNVEGKVAIVGLWLAAMNTMAAVVQMVENGDAWFNVDTADPGRDHAVGRWYIQERYQRVGGEVGLLLAHYDDLYVRSASGWLFAQRFLQVHYQGPADLSGSFHNTEEKLAARSEGNA